MSIINTQPLIGASGQGGGYNLTKSLRFRSSATAYLSRTPASAGNRRTWTYSAWVKRGKLGGYQSLIAAGTTINTDLTFHNAVDSYGLDFGIYTGGAYVGRKLTSSLYRDCSAWYHVVAVMDTTNATAADRMRLYVNGVQVTAFSVSTNPSQNTDTDINNTVAHNVGNNPAASYPLDGYLTEVNFIDGQALTPSSFGETDSITGVWQPKRYTGTYGTNGFYLPFTDVATTSGSNAGLGKDFSGNGNYWNTNNISVTSGTTYDSMTDVPTLTSATAANYATLNPLAIGLYSTNINGNLTISGVSSTNGTGSLSTIGFSSGKFYYEAVANSTTACQIGVVTYYANNPAYLTDENNVYGTTGSNKGIGIRGSGSTYGNAAEKQTIASFTFSAGDVIGIATDADNGAVYFSVNGTWLNSGVPTSGASKTGSFSNWTPSADRICYPAACTYSSGNSTSVNFGQRPFAYTPPTGYVALNTYNLPDSTIVAGNKYMDATLYTGNNTARSITNAGGFKPDVLWFARRSIGGNLAFIDSNRGLTKVLVTSDSAIEQTSTAGTGVTALNSNGFSLGTDLTTHGSTNTNNETYVAWQWQAGQGTTSSNTSGSITATVSVNASAGFSVVTFTGTGANATVGHGLGVAPKFVIVRNRDTVYNWRVWHTNLSGTQLLYLNATDTTVTEATMWNSTTPTSSVFSVGTNGGVNESTKKIVAFCWSEIAGFSKFGGYVGNGSTDGTFVYTGFRPKYILIKRTDGTSSNWGIWDSVRGSYNVNQNFIRANTVDEETTADSTLALDILSNGFKLRGTWQGQNASGGNYIYACFAENPFKNSLAR